MTSELKPKGCPWCGHTEEQTATYLVTIVEGADPRAFGAVITRAKREGWIAANGYAPANTSNRSPKCVWRSLIYDPKKAS